jgi:hypothetical protein
VTPAITEVPSKSWVCQDCVEAGKKPKRGMYCEVCDDGKDEDATLLCDKCERGESSNTN